MEFQTFLLRIGAAFLAGFLIGLERELRHKKAGLRTNTLVAIGAAIYVLISLSLKDTDNGAVARVIGQVVTGIGFIGAGVIIHREGDILGITTAATIWCSAAVGCLAATGMFMELIICTSVVLFVNRGMFAIEGIIAKKNGNGEN
ncbi:MAG: MgtC/SapB family protein [Candidatus Delongbacteria bacterium]|nr:MgtC/SapB family protein [Candidatus Delongbacteria bacterium]MCG2759828.1 MgtC/SapB family protein [Candidatus Delongbacteria bacterium]